MKAENGPSILERITEVEHASFCPLIFSTSGGVGPAASNFLTRLAALIAKKRQLRYADTIAWLRRRIGFALARAASMCLRGARSSLHHPERAGINTIHVANSEANLL